MSTRLASADVAVIGAGVVGAAVAFHLASAGVRVAVVERGSAAGGPATGRSGGIIRSYHPGKATRRLAAASRPWFEQWPERVGGECGFRQAGVVVVGGQDHAACLAAAARELPLYGVRFELLPPADLARLLPGAEPEDVVAIGIEPGGGYADPALATRGLLAAARARGAVVLEGTSCDGIQAVGGRVSGVTTEVGTIPAGAVVLCNGWWAVPLARRLGVELPLTPRRVAVQFLRHPALAQKPWPVCIDEITQGYGRGEAGGLMLVGAPSDAPGSDPDAPQPMSAGQLAEARAVMERRLPFLTGAEYCGRRTGSDAYTPDKQPVIDRLRGIDGVWVAVGASGGGFKTAPAVGRLISDLVLGRPPEQGIDPRAFVLTRFTTPAGGS